MSAERVSGTDVGRGAVGRWIDAVRARSQGDPLVYAGAAAAVALGYYGAGRIGLELPSLTGAGGGVWPPAGLGLAVLFLYGVRLWPGIVIGDLLLGDYSTPLLT